MGWTFTRCRKSTRFCRTTPTTSEAIALPFFMIPEIFRLFSRTTEHYAYYYLGKLLATDNIVKRNGGVPQEGNLSLHLDYFRHHLAEQLPSTNFSGIGVIDFESWRPIFRQNWASLQIYRDLSIDLERQRHPFWSPKAVQQEAEARFERAGKLFMQKTLDAARRLRPKAVWGYYAYPYCFNWTPSQQSAQCVPKVIEENDQ
uniref:Hyaluronidase n=1 Tax=Trichogramma kaykai TaxID=54128 RepID=A0ABD2VTL3_9HYME